MRVDNMAEKSDTQKEKSKKDGEKDRTIKMQRMKMPGMRSNKRGI